MKVNWNADVCTHSANVVKTLPQVFKVEDGKFVTDTNAAPESEIRAAVSKCPSGALTIEEE